MKRIAHWAEGRVHYGWVVIAITFLIMLVTAGTRATPSVMMVPLEHEFGWSRATISLALSINLALFGLMGPFAAAAMLRFGLRRTVLLALAVLSVAIGLSSQMQTTWQLQLVWGLIVGCATGATAMTLGATVVNRWFVKRRGLAMGILTASSATGQLVFLPLLAALTEQQGWRPVVLVVAAAAALIIPLVFFLLPERPATVGVGAYGADDDAVPAAQTRQNPIAIAFGALQRAAKTRDFWLLFASFFICGASTNGYIGTHFIAMCGDYNLTPVKGASILAAMGLFDLAGTTFSGWLSDRYNARILLFWYYGLRGLALLYLPYAFGFGLFGLPLFTMFYGLDWVATVPPTVRLTTDRFGTQDGPVIFGWVVAGHQLGAAFAALGAGMLRSSLGSYTVATWISGGLCIVGALLVLRINRNPGATAGQPALAPAAGT
ncbi:putative L-galactonate transporter [Andreprevotia sp. IGB-42]|uniref:MFS transporter n=1 Tax=Andreprevotia sp. IGB-42 TaxID=2497473 RepID=UPI00135C2B3F|nr:MFS transporter [Andreprevotia sp. IGB-42]KAF0813157.1 putative L-galactonate transporter [Andreprevotia sp. IGB-42]